MDHQAQFPLLFVVKVSKETKYKIAVIFIFLIHLHTELYKHVKNLQFNDNDKKILRLKMWSVITHGQTMSGGTVRMHASGSEAPCMSHTRPLP